MQTDLKKQENPSVSLQKNLASNDSKISRLQAIARDVLAENQEILEPILSIISRPDFRRILDLAGTGKGVIQKQAFIAEIRKIYTSQVLAQLSLFIDGILALDTKDQEEYLSDWDLEECSDPLVDPCIPDQIIVFSDGEEQDDYIYEDQHHGRDSHYRFQDAYIDSDLENRSSKSVDKPLLLIEGVTALLSVTPLVAGFAAILIMKLMPQIETSYLMIIYTFVVHWCFSGIGAISSKKRMTIKKWIALSSPLSIIRDISMTYDTGLSFFQFLMLLVTLCWLLVAPLFAFVIKTV